MKHENLLAYINGTLQSNYKYNDPIVIGITGTVGKSSIAYLISEYLKVLGKKVTLLSSTNIRLPNTYIQDNISAPVPIRSTEFLKYFIQKSIDYNSEYIIIEVSEESIKDNRIGNIPFDIKILTQFWDHWNDGVETNEEYLNNKLKFFKQEDDVMYFLNVASNNFNSFKNNVKNYILFGSKYNSNKVKLDDIDYSINKFYYTLNKQYISIKHNEKEFNIKTNTIYYAPGTINIACIIAVLDYLNILNINLLNYVITNKPVPGRNKLYLNERTIFITQNYTNEIASIGELLNGVYDEQNKEALELIGEEYKQVNGNILVLDGIRGFKPEWTDTEVSTEDEFIRVTNENKQMLINTKRNGYKYIDKVYITNINPGLANQDYILDYTEELYKQSCLPIIKIKDRKEAIKKILSDSKPGDIIFISGRASMQTYDIGTDVMCFTDEEIIRQVLGGIK